jgi:hypothetical protein
LEIRQINMTELSDGLSSYNCKAIITHSLVNLLKRSEWRRKAGDGHLLILGQLA